MNSFFENLIFGDAWDDFSGSLFGRKKMIANSAIDSENLKDEEGKYKLTFPTRGIDDDLLKISVDAKNNRITVSYEKEDEHSSVHYKYTRNVPEDADIKTAKAESNGGYLTITFEKKQKDEVKPVDSKTINIEFTE